MEFINLSSTAATLLITLYSRANMSRQNLIIKDEKAEEIIQVTGYSQKKLKTKKSHQIFLTIRAKLIDDYTQEFINLNNGNCTIIQFACGLDSRYERINHPNVKWYDLDLYGTIELRKKFYKQTPNYKMIESNVCNFTWINKLNPEDLKKPTLVIAEGLFMYLTEEENKLVINKISKTFKNCELIFDVFNTISVKFSRFAPSLRRVNANLKFGYNHCKFMENMCSVEHLKTHFYYDCDKINDLPFILKNRFNFRKISGFAKKVQRIEIYRNK